jgi:hypothetical protein
MRTRDYLRTISKINISDSDPEEVKIALDTCVEVDIVGVKFVKQ